MLGANIACWRRLQCILLDPGEVFDISNLNHRHWIKKLFLSLQLANCQYSIFICFHRFNRLYLLPNYRSTKWWIEKNLVHMSAVLAILHNTVVDGNSYHKSGHTRGSEFILTIIHNFIERLCSFDRESIQYKLYMI